MTSGGAVRFNGPRWMAGVRGLRLIATDGHVETGAGRLVSGRTIALIIAMTGRVMFCDELDGDGVAFVRQRCL